MNFKKHDDPEMEKFISGTALHMARLCVRNTIIETYHVDGKLTQEEMEAFNREVVNKLYSYLQLLYNPSLSEQRKILFKTPYFAALPDWDSPKFDSDFISAIKIIEDRLKDDRK